MGLYLQAFYLLFEMRRDSASCPGQSQTCFMVLEPAILPQSSSVTRVIDISATPSFISPLCCLWFVSHASMCCTHVCGVTLSHASKCGGHRLASMVFSVTLTSLFETESLIEHRLDGY